MDIYEQEREIQDRVSSAYDSVYGSLIAYEDRWHWLCEYVGQAATQKASILEIGCGTATFLAHMRDRGYTNLIGCDLSPETITQANKKVPEAQLDVANMIYLPYSESSVDVAVFMGSLHHLPLSDIRLAMAEAARVLKTGGTMIIADANADFDNFQPALITKIVRKCFTLKNHFIRRRLWQFDPDHTENYTDEHTHKTKIDYINAAFSSGNFVLVNEHLSEHFAVQFEGCLFKIKIIDVLFYRLLKYLDSLVDVGPQAQLLLTFKKLGAS